jgi:hypothetical protein
MNATFRNDGMKWHAPPPAAAPEGGSGSMSTIGKLSQLAAMVAFVGLGCTGQVERGSTIDPGDNGDNGAGGSGDRGTGGSGPGGAGGMAGPDALGHAIFRRLSRFEYNNTVRDLLGDSSNPADSFPPDAQAGKSGFLVGGTVAQADAAHLLEASEALGLAASKRLDALMPCKPLPTDAAAQDTCAVTFIGQFGKRAFRRPLTPDETSGLKAFYTAQRSANPSDWGAAIRVVVTAVLMSPQFLYRWEVTPKSAVREGGLVRYNSYEMASRLSYLVWGSMPDDAAFGLADKGLLATPDQIEAEVRRLLKDPRSKAAIGDFFTQWLGVADLRSAAKDAKVYPQFTPEMAASMVAETAAYAASKVIDGDGKLSTIFTSSDSFVDANLGKIYGMAGVTSATVTPTKLNPAERAGILTNASFLTQHASSDESNPVRRGKLITDRILCVEPPPPPDVVPQVKSPDPKLSVRERFEMHDKDPCAAACHLMFDPIGYSFENYNGIGAYQTSDGGKPVNAASETEIDKVKKPFKNAIELQALFAQSPQVADCMGRQFLRYALRRREVKGDEPSLAAMLAALGKTNNLREVIVALTKSRAFTHRTPSNGEVLQ